MSEIDEENEYIAGDPEDDPQSQPRIQVLESIWHDDKIHKFTDEKGKSCWKCLWCGLVFQQWNATKALFHVNKTHGKDIRKCDCRSIDHAHQLEYKRLLQKQLARKNAQQKFRELKNKSSDEYLLEAGAAYAATQQKKTPPSNITASSTPASGSSTQQKQSLLNFAVETPENSSDTPRYHQTKLGDHENPSAENQLTVAIADLIHSCGLPFSLASHHKFKRVLQLAKAVSSKYTPPGRNQVAGPLLDFNYNQYKKRMLEDAKKDADIFGITFFGDGATVKKSPLINILVSSVYLPVGCLAIVDCTGHLQSNGKKDASYISELFLPHITEMEASAPNCTDLVIFDGATNVQKAGQLLEAQFPHLSVIHGAEHVISLFYADVFHIKEFDMLKKMNRLIYRYFGSGSMHSPYAIFSKHSQDHNNGRSIGLIRASDTRMGGHVISMLRTLRLKAALTSTISSVSFIQGKFLVEKKLIDLLRRESTWDVMAKFIRAVFPMLVVLRLADQKDPVMDKLYFYVRRMDKTLEKSKLILDELGKRTNGLYWSFLANYSDEGIEDNNDETINDPNSTDTSTNSENFESGTDTTTLGQKVINVWNKRREKLVSDFSIAGWLMSPIPEVFEDSTSNMDGDHRSALDRLLKKMMGSGLADDSDELASIMNTFWSEFEQFKSKTGNFGRAYIWNPNNPDLLLGRSHMWHKTNSYFHTKVFGKFACRVCSKIVGMGSAERNWGDVKHLKTDKRAHLSSDSVQKQATIFGASCMADAAMERQKALSLTTEPYKFWDEHDFDSEFDLFARKEPAKKPPRILKCYFEDWEHEAVRKKDDVSKAKLLHKYGGLEFDDLDDEDAIHRRHLVIDSNDMCFTHKRWCVIAYCRKEDDEEEEDTEPWFLEPGCALYDCLANYYTSHQEKNVQIVLLKNQAKDGDYLVNLSAWTDSDKPERTTTPKNRKSDAATKTATPKKRKSDVTPMNKKTDIGSKSRNSDRSIHLHAATSKKYRVTNSADLAPCGGCGNQVGPVHQCDKCHRHMHPFCGRTIGEEGYGAMVRCKECDSKSGDE